MVFQRMGMPRRTLRHRSSAEHETSARTSLIHVLIPRNIAAIGTLTLRTIVLLLSAVAAEPNAVFEQFYEFRRNPRREERELFLGVPLFLFSTIILATEK